MHLIKEKLDIEESLENRIKNMLKFLNIKSKIERGNIISIKNTNLAYVEPHKLVVGEITYLLFNDCENVYINDLNNFVLLKDLENHIRNYQSL